MVKKKNTIKLQNYGDQAAYARTIAQAIDRIPAYKEFLSQHRISKISQKHYCDLPLTDKQNYCSKWSYYSLVPAEHWKSIYFVFRSSGASGKPFYWPQLKENYKVFDRQLEATLVHSFNIDKKNTLAVVGLALGSWIGGDLISWAVKALSLRSKYSLTVFSPGNQHDEILDIITRARHIPDQVLLFLCPSAIGHLLLLAEQTKTVLPMSKLRFAVIGEPFSEDYRQRISKCCHVNFPDVSMSSAYGSADTGIIGTESKASIWLRYFLSMDKDLRDAIGIKEPLPNFYHIISNNAYIEVVNGELVFTLWQGLPLIRYNLHDRGDILRWSELRKVLVKCRVKKQLERIKSYIVNCGMLPDMVAIYGRSDRTIFLCGTNISEAMLTYTMQDKLLNEYVSGNFSVSVLDSAQRQRLRWNIELKSGITASRTLEDTIYRVLIKRLGEVQPEFAVDYANIYKRWDEDRNQRIFEIVFHSWPELQNKQRSIKHKLIM